MENLAKPSVLKNHKNSFNSSIKALREMTDNLSSEYSQIADNISAYSKKREGIIHSLEDKFKKYNLDYKQPLIQNSSEDIIKYAEELESQLDISLASIDGEKKLKVIDDSLTIPSEITQLEVISEKINNASKRIEELENQVHMIRIPEKDSHEEKVINFNDYLKNMNGVSETKETKEEKNTTIDFSSAFESDSISSDIFNEEEQDEEELSQYISNLIDEENESIKVNMNNISSFSDKVKAVYGDEEFIDDVYNFHNNKRIIDQKAGELGMSPNEAMEDKSALNGIVIDFPTEIDIYTKDDVKKLG